MSKNIFISTLGATPGIIEETIGFSNYSDNADFYYGSLFSQQINDSRKMLDFANNKADELWLIATDKVHSNNVSSGKEINSTTEDFKEIKEACSKYVESIRIFILKGIPDITNIEEANAFHDLALRVVAFAKQQTHGGKLYLSLACGRKTMSADMQDAAYCFGCDALIHVLGNSHHDAFPLSLGKIPANGALVIDSPYFEDKEVLPCSPEFHYFETTQKQKEVSQHFFTTYYLNEDDTHSNFHILYTLPPSKIRELKETKIGINRDKQREELEFIKRLPKTDLHCHLGGVLSPEEMIEVAKCYIPLIEKYIDDNVPFANWLEEIKHDNGMKQPPKNWKEWRTNLEKQLNVEAGVVAAAFLLCYDGRAEELKKLIYGNYAEETEFMSIGIEKYESLGDLQGSALLRNEAAIRKTVQILLHNCEKENVVYLELRCSPINYKTNDMSTEQIIEVILEELDKCKNRVESSVILIASRHSESEKIRKSIELVQNMKDNALFKHYFRGFDLAGAENARTPKEMREQFLEIMKDCLNITIHAGENMPSENIWEAVYFLNAERIGHGLTLQDNNDLMNKFLERSIGVEMCPSSNYQIVGFTDNYYSEISSFVNNKEASKDYPLKMYLDNGLMVSINTDDPGISCTNETKELHRAARLTCGGLSKWDILQLLYNGFKTAFYPYADKHKLIHKAEKMIGELIQRDLL